MPSATSLKELRAMSTEDLIELYDSTAQRTVVGLEFLRQEIIRRDNVEETKIMKQLTKQMRDLTIVITVLTVINLIVTSVVIFKK